MARVATGLAVLALLAAACSSGGLEATPSPTGLPQRPTTTANAPACTPTTYTVVSGDVLSAISARFDVDLQALIAANQITNPDVLAVGQQLSIPCPGAASTVTPGASVTPRASASATPRASVTPTASH